MTNRRYRLGAVLAVFAAAVAAWLPATSAQAAEADGPVVRIHLQDDNLGLPLPPNTYDPPQVNWGLDNDGPGTAKDVTIRADLSNVIDWVTPDATVPADHIYTWPTRDVSEGPGDGSLIGLSAKPGTPLGTTGTVTLSGTSTNGTVVPVTAKVTVGTNDLTVNQLPTRKGDKPGSTIDTPITISNVGTLPSDGVQLRMRTTIGLAYAEHFSNCVYSKESPDPYGLTEQAVCTFDTVVEPGKKYRLDQPVGLDVTEQALFEYFSHEALPLSGPGSTARSGNGPVLSLVADGAAATDGTEIDRQHIDADSTADMVAGGDTAKGEHGDLVHVTVSLTNEGPGWVGYNASDDQPALMFTVPTGAKAVEIPEHCSVWNIDGPSGEQTPGAPKYICQSSPSEFTVGDSRSFEFGLRIRAHAKTTTGEAKATTAYGSIMAFDHNHGNDTAAVTVEVKGGGTPSPSASASPVSGTGTGGNNPSTQTVSSADDTGTGPLASTGSSDAVRVAAAWGAGALLLGGGLVVLARRRNSTSMKP
ncbi:LPXTG cell wall anchor domain-containing protein [Streptomyces pseudovenezuelae]|uniref:LPXTG-motif cell wall-anchored protein n=1 Tax=Streptomyces pseudovenezuelae TaxID=67350 RepID=A0ABT6LEP2_9ACTN|nr:LPXTG cell wall anchor domain-containing protein [Streptomyces pseudovenezuelae]MDH6214768.1 LPXTG-motif cell wall-anchored protein [Streptomyces pseudovenezuelae]